MDFLSYFNCKWCGTNWTCLRPVHKPLGECPSCNRCVKAYASVPVQDKLYPKVKITVISTHLCVELCRYLAEECSTPYEAVPLPDDCWEVTFKKEHEQRAWDHVFEHVGEHEEGLAKKEEVYA